MPDTRAGSVIESPGLEAVRERLAAAQAALVAALVAGGPDPVGFDPGALGATRGSLLAKRRRQVARHWPVFAAEPGFTDRFTVFAASRPPMGSHLDGLAFARAHRADLSVAARRVLLASEVGPRPLAFRADRVPGASTLLAVRLVHGRVAVARVPRRRRRAQFGDSAPTR